MRYYNSIETTIAYIILCQKGEVVRGQTIELPDTGAVALGGPTLVGSPTLVGGPAIGAIYLGNNQHTLHNILQKYKSNNKTDQ
jgi:ribose/xylose/arabinose/galactoside ABC-type transport system permease subunit